jgi:hypothetical protein
MSAGSRPQSRGLGTVYLIHHRANPRLSELYPESPESAARTFDELMLIYAS